MSAFDPKRRYRALLFDHVGGGGAQRLRHGEAKRLGGVEVDEQLDLRRLLDRQVSRSRWSRL
jgi:hypothetical protein